MVVSDRFNAAYHVLANCFIMNYTQELRRGHVYLLVDYTAPKVFTGLYFECLVTDQKIPAHAKAKKCLCPINEWDGHIYRPTRFHALTF